MIYLTLLERGIVADLFCGRWNIRPPLILEHAKRSTQIQLCSWLFHLLSRWAFSNHVTHIQPCPAVDMRIVTMHLSAHPLSRFPRTWARGTRFRVPCKRCSVRNHRTVLHSRSTSRKINIWNIRSMNSVRCMYAYVGPTHVSAPHTSMTPNTLDYVEGRNN
jgi:hypothetical protein